MYTRERARGTEYLTKVAETLMLNSIFRLGQMRTLRVWDFSGKESNAHEDGKASVW